MSDMVEVKYCGSVPAFGGKTREYIGWMYGVHILGDDSGAGPCPICGLEVGMDTEKTKSEVKCKNCSSEKWVSISGGLCEKCR